MTTLPVGLQSLNAAGAIVSPATLEQQKRHELHASLQKVVTATTTVRQIATLLGSAVPSWVTSCRLYIGSAGRVAYSCDGVNPAFAAGNVTHGAPLDAYTQGHLIVGGASVASLRLVAETANTAVTVELMG